MPRISPLLLVIAILVAPRLVAADSIDDAEAKRRGVPVSQVIAERQLAAAKTQNAALEKQLDDLRKQVDTLRLTTASAPSKVAATPGETYHILLNRPPVQDVPYDAHYVISYGMTGIKLPRGAEPTMISESFNAELSGGFRVQDIENGQATTVLLRTHLFKANDKEVFPPEQFFLIQPHEAVMYYETRGPAEFPELGRRTLNQIFLNILPTPPNEDDMYGSKEPHKVNDEWPMNAKLALPSLEALTKLKFNPEKVKGKTKLAGIEMVGTIKVFRIVIAVDMTDFTPIEPHAGYTVTSSTLRLTFTRLVPLEPQIPVLHEELIYKGLLSEKTGGGDQFDIKIDISRTMDVTPPVANTPNPSPK